MAHKVSTWKHHTSATLWSGWMGNGEVSETLPRCSSLPSSLLPQVFCSATLPQSLFPPVSTLRLPITDFLLWLSLGQPSWWSWHRHRYQGLTSGLGFTAVRLYSSLGHWFCSWEKIGLLHPSCNETWLSLSYNFFNDVILVDMSFRINLLLSRVAV